MAQKYMKSDTTMKNVHKLIHDISIDGIDKYTQFLKKQGEISIDNIDELALKFKKTEISTKKIKKKSRISGYNIYQKERMEEMKHSFPDMKSDERMTKSSKGWKNELTEEQREVFNQKAILENEKRKAQLENDETEGETEVDKPENKPKKERKKRVTKKKKKQQDSDKEESTEEVDTD